MSELEIRVSFDSDGNLKELEICCEGDSCECTNVVNAVLDALKDNEVETSEAEVENSST